ncbi:MAG: hypothetical protein GXP39_05260 [Chloroflexi bacterium]|nr:hypothetical protein [Chloroflexota bacterium]
MEPRPGGVLVIALYHLVVGVVTGLGICALLTIPFIVGVAASGDPDARIAVPIVGGIMVLAAGFLFLLALANLLVGWGLWHMREWARIAAIGLSVLRLLNFPIGTIIGGLIIWYLLQPQIVAAFQTQQTG